MRELGIRERIIDKQSPWQNVYVERAIWTVRRECLSHVIILSARHLRRILTEYVDYYNSSRAHLALDQDCPIHRPVQSINEGNSVVKIPYLGGLHHRYERHVA